MDLEKKLIKAFKTVKKVEERSKKGSKIVKKRIENAQKEVYLKVRIEVTCASAITKFPL